MEETELNQEKKYYLESWKRLLWELLRWPEEKVLEWVENNKTYLLGNPLLTHETPMYYITHLLLSQNIWRMLCPSECLKLENRLEKAIGHGESFPLFDDSFEWRIVVQAVEQILNEYGYRLPLNE